MKCKWVDIRSSKEDKIHDSNILREYILIKEVNRYAMNDNIMWRKLQYSCEERAVVLKARMGLISICRDTGESLDRGDVIQMWHTMDTDGYNLDR